LRPVAVFGSGRVARPALRTLLDSGHGVLVATEDLKAAETLLESHPRGSAVKLDATDASQVKRIVEESSLALSLLPPKLHVVVAEACLEARRPFVSTSYVSEEMRALDARARRAGVLLLNEVGADPGLDHMQAMRLIRRVRERRGRVTGFTSLCGGIPAPEANDNPFGYKVSWSPRGVVLAGTRPARHLAEGRIVEVAPREIFDHAKPVVFEDLGELESYPNGDSIRFQDEYGLSGLRTMLRGTLRWKGWCETWSALSHLGWIDESWEPGLGSSTYEAEMRRSLGAREGELTRSAAAKRLRISEGHPLLGRLEWLGLFEDVPVPAGVRSRVDLLVARMEERMRYQPGERDLLLLRHTIDFEDERGRPGSLTSTTAAFGVPGGDSAMARTVGTPAAFAACRILDGTIREFGVRIPVLPSIYEPILSDLAAEGIEENLVTT
jgi:saccharopine dehydrogenase-like NADP-dependent oxidoreductase